MVKSIVKNGAAGEEKIHRALPDLGGGELRGWDRGWTNIGIGLAPPGEQTGSNIFSWIRMQLHSLRLGTSCLELVSSSCRHCGGSHQGLRYSKHPTRLHCSCQATLCCDPTWCSLHGKQGQALSGSLQETEVLHEAELLKVCRTPQHGALWVPFSQEIQSKVLTTSGH